MTVYIAHAESDRPVAEALEKFLERRGLFVELENGERGFRHVQPSDTVVALWSKDTVFTPFRLQFEKRTLEAWADEQLVLVKLDHTFAPVGMRDLPSIDASFELQRDIAWAAVAKTAQDARTRPAPAPAPMSADRAAPPGGAAATALPQQTQSASRSATGEAASPSGMVIILLPLVMLVIGAGLYVVATTRADILEALPKNAYQTMLPFGGAVLALLLIGFTFVMTTRSGGGPAKKKRAREGDGDATGAAESLFVSYAHADNMAVVPVVEAVQAQGRSVWLDKGGIAAGEGWAGEIVRAIKSAKGVIVMCSAHAFESDH